MPNTNSNTPTPWSKIVTLTYQILAAAAILLGFVWYLAGWRGTVDTRLLNIETTVKNLDQKVDGISHQLDQLIGSHQISVKDFSQ